MRRILNLAFVASLALASSALAAKGGQLISNGGDIELYANAKRAVNEAAVYKAPSTEILVEMDRKGDKVLVMSKGGQLWAEAGKLQKYEKTSGSNMDLGQGKIEGVLDNPGTIYILQQDNAALEGIKLERDFKDAIQGNVDRETVEYRNGENR